MRLAVLVFLYSAAMAGTNLLLKAAALHTGWRWWALFAAANAVGFTCVVVMPFALRLAPSNLVYALCIGGGFCLLQLAAWLLFREALSPWQWTGVACVALGIVLLQWRG